MGEQVVVVESVEMEVTLEVAVQKGALIDAFRLSDIAARAGQMVARVVDSHTGPCPVCGRNTILGDICVDCRKLARSEPDNELHKGYWIKRRVEELDWLADALGETPAEVEVDLSAPDVQAEEEVDYRADRRSTIREELYG